MRKLYLIAILLATTATQAQDITTSGTMSFRTARPEDTAIQIYGPSQEGHAMGTLVVTIRMNGNVEFGPGFTADDAIREFWKNLGMFLPNKCEDSNALPKP